MMTMIIDYSATQQQTISNDKFDHKVHVGLLIERCWMSCSFKLLINDLLSESVFEVKLGLLINNTCSMN